MKSGLWAITSMLTGIVGCVGSADTAETSVTIVDTSDTSEEDTSTYVVSHPLFFTTMTHLEGGTPYDESVRLFDEAVIELEVALEMASSYDARLTIESEKPFAVACASSGRNFLAEILAAGHGVGTHCDKDRDAGDLTQTEAVELLVDRKGYVDALVGSENNNGCSGATEAQWVEAYISAGFGYIDGVVSNAYKSTDESAWPEGWTLQDITSRFSHDPAPPDLLNDRMYLRLLKDTFDLEHDPDGELVLLGGGLGRPDAQHLDGDDGGFSNLDVDALVATVRSARTSQDESRVAMINVHLSMEHLNSDLSEELEYFFSELQALQDEGVIQWATQSEVYNYYLRSME